MSHAKITVVGAAEANRTEYTLAKDCYGYGCWEAPFWFIGPEQGQSASENNSFELRHQAFRKLRIRGLCDCATFHHAIHEERWHRARPALQPTWRRLILLLMAFLGESEDNESLRVYQRDRWGGRNGETCVIELSGLPANNLNVPRKRELFLQRRIKFIREKMLRHNPVFVVMYGKGNLKHWAQIAGKDRLKPDRAQKVGSTVVVASANPVAYGLKKKYWVALGQRMHSLT